MIAEPVEGEKIRIDGDLRDKASLERACAGVEVVYHIAAIYRQAGLRDEDGCSGQPPDPGDGPNRRSRR